MNRYLALKTIVEYGNFSRAAEILGYTQPAISQMIASLEAELGVTLLQRSRSGASLTEEGKDIYPFIEQTLVAESRIREKADEVQGLETGIVRIATISSVSTRWLPDKISQFMQSYPGVRFDIKNGNFSGVLDLLRTGMADMAITSVETAGSFQKDYLVSGPMLLVLPKGHPLAAWNVVPLELLRTEPSVFLEKGDFHEPTRALTDIGIYPETRIDVQNDDHTVMAMVEQGLGISILSEMMLERNGFEIELRQTDPPIVRHLGAVYKEYDQLPAAAKRFLSFLKSFVGN